MQVSALQILSRLLLASKHSVCEEIIVAGFRLVIQENYRIKCFSDLRVEVSRVQKSRLFKGAKS